MYQFKIRRQDSGGFRFELGDINILIDGYTVADDKHLLQNPNKAIAYFNINDSIYGVSNEPLQYNSVEDFYEAMSLQYKIVTNPLRRSA